MTRTGPARRIYSDPTYATRWARRLAENRAKARSKGEAALREIEGCGKALLREPLPVDARHSVIGEAASRLAADMAERIHAIDRTTTTGALLGWLNEQLEGTPAVRFRFSCKRPEGVQIAGMFKRAESPEWWRRQLGRDVVRRAEREAIHGGRVNALADQWYCSDETVRRRIVQNKRNREILERTELENEEGEVFTLQALADTGTGNKAVRRGELMTRIRGCEEWADAQEHEGVFLTLTAPSRFHQHRIKGGMNPNYRGATPREAQAWLCATWAKARARVARIGLSMYGFRVAEPHHDGCPHWHALFWAPADQVKRLVTNLRAAWLKELPDEPGAQKHRFKSKRMLHGGAAGYVAKYIAKNIDDAGAVEVEGHHDEHEGDEVRFTGAAQGELFKNPALRVEAWASAWGIRQFQAIGQPPVTVWRELRRVEAAAAQEAPFRIQAAWDRAHRHDDERACFHTYINAQGGTNTGRDYRIRMAVLIAEKEGRYETVDVAQPIGVYEAGKPEALVPSMRKTWRPRGATPVIQGARPLRVAQRRAPWTRFNNCTQAGFRGVVAALLDRSKIITSWAGGPSTETENEPEPPPPHQHRHLAPERDDCGHLRPPLHPETGRRNALASLLDLGIVGATRHRA